MIRQISLLFLIFSFSLLLSQSSDACPNKEPCVFVGRNDGNWVSLDESPSKHLPYAPVSDSWRRNDTTLHIAISSFRDKLCPRTLFNIFSKASHPERISVGVIQQNEKNDVDCLDGYCALALNDKAFREKYLLGGNCPFRSSVQMTRVAASEAQGPVWARALGSQMIAQEEFCMQIDAHMDFSMDFDVHLLAMWGLTENEYGILSTYVSDAETMDVNAPGRTGTNGLFEVPHLCMVLFHGAGGMPRNFGTKCLRMATKPKLTNAVWGAGLSFSKCHAEKKVPYDIHLPKIFDGEEFSRAARFWTHGYDIYTPHRVLVFHDYKKSQADPTHSAWMHGSSGVDTIGNSQNRLRAMLDMPGYSGDAAESLAIRRSKYGLGDRRSLDQLIEFSGVDTRSTKVLGNRCGPLEFVPFKEHPLGSDHVTKYASDSSEALIEAPDAGSIYFDADEDRKRRGALVATAVPPDRKNTGVFKSALRELGGGITPMDGGFVHQDPDKSVFAGVVLLLIALVIVFIPFAIRRGVFLFKKQSEDDD